MHYIIGDLQGCFTSFKALIKKIGFKPSRDRLLLVGDLVARGSDSLATMRYILKHRDSIDVVLGNHDLHLLAVARGFKKAKPSDKTKKLLQSEFYPAIDHFLRQQPLVRDYKELGIIMAHAGIWPSWTPKKAVKRSAEIEALLQDDNEVDYLLEHMYGDGPSRWSKALQGMDRNRAIINIFTRMRLMTVGGDIDLSYKGPMDAKARIRGFKPWFESDFKLKKRRIAFGHWAALEGDSLGHEHVIPLDTGCVYGGKLTAYCVEEDRFISVDSLDEPHLW